VRGGCIGGANELAQSEQQRNMRVATLEAVRRFDLRNQLTQRRSDWLR